MDFASGEQTKPNYLAINPKGRVPALVTERGVLTETPAILAYIAQTWPAAGLAPLDDPFAFAADAGVHELSLLDRARRPCASGARLPLGRRSGGDRSHEAQGPANRRRVLRH